MLEPAEVARRLLAEHWPRSGAFVERAEKELVAPGLGFRGLFASVPRFFAQWARPMQNGLVQFYALSMALGLVVFLTFVLFRVTR